MDCNGKDDRVRDLLHPFALWSNTLGEHRNGSTRQLSDKAGIYSID